MWPLLQRPTQARRPRAPSLIPLLPASIHIHTMSLPVRRHTCISHPPPAPTAPPDCFPLINAIKPQHHVIAFKEEAEEGLRRGRGETAGMSLVVHQTCGYDGEQAQTARTREQAQTARTIGQAQTPPASYTPLTRLLDGCYQGGDLGEGCLESGEAALHPEHHLEEQRELRLLVLRLPR